MKRIEVVIAPWELEELRPLLLEHGIKGLTVTEVVALGSPPRAQVFRGSPYVRDSVARLKVEIVVADGSVADVIEALERLTALCKTRHVSHVTAVLQVLRIRTGEWGERAV